MITEETARSVAAEDAAIAYHDLSIYRVSARFEDGCWYVDYDLEDPDLLGGGPHYVIDGQSGEILSRRYEQ